LTPTSLFLKNGKGNRLGTGSRISPGKRDQWSPLVAALPDALLADACALAAEAGRRRLGDAVTALVALCNRFVGFGVSIRFAGDPRQIHGYPSRAGVRVPSPSVVSRQHFHVPEALLSAAPFFVVAAEPIDGAKSLQIMGRTPLA
jgi:hypothetical protein